MAKLKKEFFERPADIVAKDLLGKIIVRKTSKDTMRAKIVETEAYFDEKDPASRAVHKGDLRKTMEMEPGTILVYGVHNNWLVNFVTGVEGNASAVLIRAIEPLNFKGRVSGPGLLTHTLMIGKEFHKKNLSKNNQLWVEDPMQEKPLILSDFRVGVKRDLPRKLRFYINGNFYVSKK